MRTESGGWLCDDAICMACLLCWIMSCSALLPYPSVHLLTCHLHLKLVVPKRSFHNFTLCCFHMRKPCCTHAKTLVVQIATVRVAIDALMDEFTDATIPVDELQV